MNERSDRLMKALGDIGADLIAKAAPVFPEAPDTSEHGNIIAVTPYEPEIQLTKRDIRIYWITRILGAAAAIAIIGTGVFLLWKNWDKIAVKEPDRPGAVTVVSEPSYIKDLPDISEAYGKTIEFGSASVRLSKLSYDGTSLNTTFYLLYNGSDDVPYPVLWINVEGEECAPSCATEPIMEADSYNYVVYSSVRVSLEPGRAYALNVEYSEDGIRESDPQKYRFICPVVNAVTTVGTTNDPFLTSTVEALIEPDEVDCFEQITDTSMPEPFDSEYSLSDYNKFDIAWQTKLGNAAFMLSWDDKKLNEWVEYYDFFETGYNLHNTGNIFDIAKRTEMTRNELSETVKKWNTYCEERIADGQDEYEFEIFSDEETEILLSGDEERIARQFASEYSVVIGENVFSPKWLYYHTIEDYKAVGIHPETITQNMAMYEGLGLTDEAWAAFKAKLESYIIRGKTIPDDMLGEWSVEKVTENAFSEQEFGADNLESVNKMLESLGNEEVAALYKQAYALRTLTERDYEDFANSELLKKIYGDDYGTDPERAVLIDINGRSYACNSGFLWDSVVNGFKSVFTEKYADELFAGLPGDQYHYGKELYYSGVTSTLRVMLYPEYTVLKNNTDEIVIRETCYNIDYETRKVTDEVRYVNENRFVKTSDGWKCAYFGIIDKDKITQ